MKNIGVFCVNLFVVIVTEFFGVAGIICLSLYIDMSGLPFFVENFVATISAYCVFITAIALLNIGALQTKKIILSKTFSALTFLFCIIPICLFVAGRSGFLDKVNSVEAFRDYVQSFGNFAVIQFIIIQFLQVVVLPVPSVITVAGGVLMFGAFYGALFSCVGIIFGSFVAFFIGRGLGGKAVKWLVGEKALKKGTALLSGGNKYLFTLMFLFPCFPDDLLCFVAGVVKIKTSFFTATVIFARTVSVFTAAYSLNNNLIPYDTWWGVLLWISFFTITVSAVWLIAKRKNKNI